MGRRIKTIEVHEHPVLRRAIRPSRLGDCPRSLYYRMVETPETGSDISELRAKRGTALHTISPDIVAFAWKYSEFNELPLEFTGQEVPVTIPILGERTRFLVHGTVDLTGVIGSPGAQVSACFDLKCYSQVPAAPYPGNVLQVMLYRQGTNSDRGYLVYMPDAGGPKLFEVASGEEVLSGIGRSIEGLLRSAECETPPERLKPSDKRCAYCPFHDVCWEPMLSELGEYNERKHNIPTLVYGDADLQTQAAVQSFLESRKQIRSLETLEAESKDAILEVMERRRRYILVGIPPTNDTITAYKTKAGTFGLKITRGGNSA